MYKFVDAVQGELNRLGVEQGTPDSLNNFLDSNWHTPAKTTWQKTDPQGQLTGVSDFYQCFFGLRWLSAGKLAYLDPVDDEIRPVQMCQTSENYDLVIRGQRVLLYTFAYDESYQLFCSFDLLQQSPDPHVYAVPHDEYERAYVRYGTVSEFLRTLHKKERLVALLENEEEEEE